MDINKEVVSKELEEFKDSYTTAHKRVISYLKLPETSIEEVEAKKEQTHELYLKWLPEFSNNFRSQLKNLSQNAYTKFYQAVGDNIRTSGSPKYGEFNSAKMFDLAITINMVIKSARYVSKKNNKPCFVVLDAIRNPYEAIFFKERYADFYLVSINTSNDNRLSHLRNSHKFSAVQIEELDNKEYPERLKGHTKFVSQNIQKCIELADIHINNPKNRSIWT